MKDKILKIGNRATDADGLIWIGKGSFVLARTAFNLPSGMFTFLPTSFFLMHHSIEVLIKAFLIFENIAYDYSKYGHRLVKLLKIGIENSERLSFFNYEILNRKDFKDLLDILEQSYIKNKYSFPGYYVSYDEVRDLFDELIYIFIEHFYKLRSTNERVSEQLRQIDVPVQLLQLMVEYKQKQQFIFCVIPFGK